MKVKNNKIKNVITDANTMHQPNMHRMFTGDAKNIYKELSEAGNIQILNQTVVPRLEMINLDNLIPLETQRFTDGNWVKKAITFQKGYDVIAAGTLMVARDPDDGKHYVFDGCGRWALAQMVGVITEIPCIVYDMPKDRAAYYFAYMQDKGRRKLDKETIFVNAWQSGETSAREEGKLLKFLDCYIVGKTNFPVPPGPTPSTAQVKHAFLTKGLEKAKGDTLLLREVRDLIGNAWGLVTSKTLVIKQDLFLGLITFLNTYPDARRGTNSIVHTALQNFLMDVARVTPNQQDLKWKLDGGNFHNHDDLSVAKGLHDAFYKSLTGQHVKTIKNLIPYNAINARVNKVLHLKDDSSTVMVNLANGFDLPPHVTLFDD